MDFTHEFAVRHTVQTNSRIDTLNPKCAEIAFFGFTIAVSIGKTFLKYVFGNGKNILAGTPVALGLIEDFLSPGA
jgi:hypothetical protein